MLKSLMPFMMLTAVLASACKGVEKTSHGSPNAKTEPAPAQPTPAEQPPTGVPTAGAVELPAWKKLAGPAFPYVTGHIVNLDGKIYVTIWKSGDKDGVYHVLESEARLEKVASLQKPYLMMDSQKTILSFSDKELHKLKSDGTWEPLLTAWDAPALDGFQPFSDNRDGVEASFTMAPQDKVLAIGVKQRDGSDVYQVFSFDLATKSWTKVGPELTGVANLPMVNSDVTGDPNFGKTTTYPMWHPRAMAMSDGKIVVANTYVTSTSVCGTAPKDQPPNLIYILEDGQWKSLSGKETGLDARGYTCGWGRVRAIVSDGGKALYATGGSGQYYKFDAVKKKWLLEDQNGYGEDPGYQATQEGLLGGPVAGHAQWIKDDAILTTGVRIEGQNCPARRSHRPAMTGAATFIVAEISTGTFEDCSPNYANDINSEKTLTTLREEQKAAQDAGKLQTVSRGLHIIPFSVRETRLRNLPLDMASYLTSHPGARESAAAVQILDEALIAVAVNGEDAVDPSTDLGLEEGFAHLNILNTKTATLQKTLRVGKRIDELGRLPDGRLLMSGSFGLVLLDAELTKTEWRHSVSDAGETRVSSSGDCIAFLSGKVVTILGLDGRKLGEKSFSNSYVNDVVLDSSHDALYVGGFDNRTRNGVPVQVAFVFRIDLKTMERTWKTWYYEAETLGEDMADTRIYRIALSPDGSALYAGGESAGGNTIFRWNGVDLSTKTLRNAGAGSSGSLWMATSSSHLLYVGRIDVATGTVRDGSFHASVLTSKQRLNTTRISEGDLVVGEDGRVYVSGVATAFIPARTAQSVGGKRVDGGDMSGYAGGDPFLMVLAPDLASRSQWTTFSAWQNRGSAHGLSVRNGKVALAVEMFSGEAITTDNALQKSPQDKTPAPEGQTQMSDAWFLMGDL